MAKVIVTENGHYRVRRGRLVRIPDEWVGRTTHPQTIRKRKSKQSGGKNNSKRAGVRRGS